VQGLEGSPGVSPGGGLLVLLMLVSSCSCSL
jgi:hypothetical protein